MQAVRPAAAFGLDGMNRRKSPRTWEWNVDTGEVHASPEVLHLFSLAPGRSPLTLGMFLERIHPEDRQVVQALQLAVAERKPFHVEYRLAAPNGTLFHVSASGEVHRHNGRRKPVVMIGVTQDVTSRKHAEQALKESEQRFRQLFDNAGDGIFIANMEGIYANASWRLVPSFPCPSRWNAAAPAVQGSSGRSE